MRRIVLIVSALAFFLSTPAWAYVTQPLPPGTPFNAIHENGIVLEIIDGSTIRFKVGERITRLRLIGIETPEPVLNNQAKKQAIEQGVKVDAIIARGKTSKKHLESLIQKGKNVMVVYDEQQKDGEGCMLGYVWKHVFLDPNKYPGEFIFINEKMLADGYAYPRVVPPNIRYADDFFDAFRKARNEKLGLWK